MHFLNRFITNVVINILLFALLAYLLDGVSYAPYLLTRKEQIEVLVKAGLWLGVLNAFVKPLLKFISFPVIILTLGLFLFVINIFILFLTNYFVPDLIIEGAVTYIYLAIIFAIVNSIEHLYLKFKKNP
ncbi:MAG: phage holin family protein [Candidatus Gracilibacteria bacterium]|nr:phage holin family protein [Candidatus Gracilibacteria bacterium]